MIITKEMIKYWLGENSKTEAINVLKELTNNKYAVNVLICDITKTWEQKEK